MTVLNILSMNPSNRLQPYLEQTGLEWLSSPSPGLLRAHCAADLCLCSRGGLRLKTRDSDTEAGEPMIPSHLFIFRVMTKWNDLSPTPEHPLMPEQGLGLRSVTAVRGPSPQTPLNKTSLRHEADVTRVAFNVRGIGPASALTGSYSWHFGGWNRDF